MQQKLFFSFLFFVLFSTTILGSPFHADIGSPYSFTNFQIFFGNETIFEENLNPGLTTQAITSPKFQAWVVDLDGSGTKNVVVLDGNIIEVYDAVTLQKKGEVDSETNVPSPMLFTDFDQDGFVEGIYVETTDTPGTVQHGYAFEYNGTAFNITNLGTHPGDFSTPNRDHSFFSCAPGVCVVANYVELGTTRTIELYAFNETFSSQTLRVHDDQSAPFDTACSPSIKYMIADDWDNDGTTEFIISSFKIGGGGTNEFLVIDTFTINSSLGVVYESAISKDLGNIINDASPTCADVGANFMVSSPYIADIDGNPANGKEVVVAVSTDTNEIKMFSFDNDGNEFDDYPELSEFEGDWIGNIFVADIFADSGRVDFCVNTADESAGQLRILCASEQTSEPLGLGDSEGYSANVATNLTESTTRWAHVAFSATVNGEEKVFTSYGSHTLERIAGSCIGDCDMISDFISSQEDAALTMGLFENNTNADLIYLTATNVWYFDDQFFNSACTDISCLNSVSFNPCREQAWKLNTTVTIQVIASDADDDDVSVQVTLYDGDSNVQSSGFSANQSSGTTFAFSFEANKTISNGNIKVEVVDVENPATIEEDDFSFTVALSGLEHGDAVCIEDFVGAVAANVTLVGLLPTEQDNFVTIGFNQLTEQTGLGSRILWLFFMAVVAIAIFLIGHEAAHTDTKSTFGVIIIVEVFMLIIGTFFGYVSFGTLLVIVILALALGAIFLRNIFMGD